MTAAALAVMTIVASSCSSARPGLSNGSVTICYRAIPEARSALHTDQATLVGVHRTTADAVVDRLPADAPRPLAGESDTSVCVLAFKGTFAAGQVDRAPAGQSGRYAVIVVSSHHLDLLASMVLEKLPSGLGRRSI
jgi:hypothetical protein